MSLSVLGFVCSHVADALISYIRTGRPPARMTANSVAEKRRSSCALAARNFCLTKAGKLSVSPSDMCAMFLRDLMCGDWILPFTAQTYEK